jgi:hypothetical protein
LGGELEPDEKKVGVGMFGIRPEGIEMDGKALDSLFRALSPADCARCCLECVWNAAAMDDLNRPGSVIMNCFDPACHGVGSCPEEDAWLPDKVSETLETPLATGAGWGSWPGSSLSGISKSSPADWRSKAAALSAAGILGEVRSVAKGLIAGCRNDWASSWSTSKSSSSAPSKNAGSRSSAGGSVCCAGGMTVTLGGFAVPSKM